MTCQTQKYLKILSLFLGLFIASQFTTDPLKAQTSISPLIVAPARQSLSGDPGENVSFAVRFYNTAPEPIPGVFKVADFIVEDNLGTPSFLEGPTVLSDRFAAAKWVNLSAEKGTIASSGMVAVNGTVKIPKNASAGGKYFAVFFEPDVNVPSANGEEQQEAAAVTMRIAALVYLKVSGPITESANIASFKAPGFSEYGPITLTTEIKNNGVYHITPEGNVVVKNMFGKEIANSKIAEVNIFPEAKRTITSEIGKKWMIGRYTANVNLTYGESQKTISGSLSFWVFPWKLAAVIILGIAIIILTIVMILNKFVKKENKLEEELTKEKDELEKLKEKYEDLISVGSDPKTPSDSDTEIK